MIVVIVSVEKMCAMRNNKRNSLPSLSMNKFFVNKRASMFEKPEEPTPREKKEWSPFGLVETSQRKMEGESTIRFTCASDFLCFSTNEACS